MQTFENSYAADWLALSLRSVVLAGLVVSIVFAGHFVTDLVWLLALGFGWSLAMTVLADLNTRLPDHRRVNLMLDTALGGGFFGLKVARLAAAWVALPLILTGAVHVQFKGALLTRSLFAVLGSISAGLNFGLGRAAGERSDGPRLPFVPNSA